MRAVKVPPNSASLEEARGKIFEFFKAPCRSLPTVMEIYNLDDVTTVSQLRSTIAVQIRKNSHVDDPKQHELGTLISHPHTALLDSFWLW